MSDKPVNKKGGKNYKKTKTRRVREIKHKVDISSDDGYYGLIMKMLGCNRIEALLHNGEKEQVVIPGKFRKRIWLKKNDMVQINDDMEIVRIVKKTDPDYKDAQLKLSKFIEEDDIKFMDENVFNDDNIKSVLPINDKMYNYSRTDKETTVDEL